ncbi:MAG: hypothetical protein JXR03_01265 [Cyclobacteriaceae bacterium]
MLTPFQHKKQTHFFNLIDVDSNGYLEPKDWINIGQRLAKLRGTVDGSAEQKEILSAAGKLWEDLSQYIEGESPNRANLEEWLKFVDEKIANAEEAFYDQYVNVVVKGVFAIMDEDKDGVIENREYSEFMHSFGMSESATKVAFSKMDQNGDGTLDESELIKSVGEFFRSDDSVSAGNWLFGPIMQ